MKKKERMALPAVGGSSLLVIFAVLTMTVFAVLSLSTVLAEQRLSEAAAASAAAYYRADLEAEEIYARLRRGETVPGVQRTENRYTYRCATSETQSLHVTLHQAAEGWSVLQWQTESVSPEQVQTLPVWKGIEGER